MRWLEISVRVPTELADNIAEVLSRYAPHGIAYDYGPIETDDTDWERPCLPPPILTLRVYLPMTGDWETARQRIEEGLWHLRQVLPFPPPQFRELDETLWEEAWKAHYDVLRVGPFVIRPPGWPSESGGARGGSSEAIGRQPRDRRSGGAR